MSIHLEVEDFNKIFEDLKVKPIIINDYQTNSVESKNFIKDLIYTKLDGDILNTIPRCNCPLTANPITGADREGEYCPTCRTKVASRYGEVMEAILWVRSPNGVEPFINPRIWQGLKQALNNRKVNTLSWITNTSYKLNNTNKKPAIIYKLEEAGIARGYNNFVRNFDRYIDIIFNIKDLKKKATTKSLLELIDNNRDKLFTRFLPLPNRSLFVIEPTNVEKTYMDLIGVNAIDAIAVMTSIDVPGQEKTLHARENRVNKYLTNMGIYQESYLRNNIAKKPGLYRKQMVSTRVSPSFRAVIVSRTDIHDSEQLHIPWNIAMVVFQPHLENIFLKNGLTANDILSIFNKYINRFDQRLYDLMMKVIRDSEEKGFPCLWNRNPTLGRSSILKLFIADIKKDVNDPTVAMSAGLVVYFNAD